MGWNGCGPGGPSSAKGTLHVTSSSGPQARAADRALLKTVSGRRLSPDREMGPLSSGEKTAPPGLIHS